MSREERLELLKQIEKDIYVPSIESTFLDDAKSCAIHSVIEELEQEPCEDAISRQAVLDYIDKMPSELTADGRRMIRRRALEEYISDTLSSVKPQEKTGYWIRTHFGFECSNCHKSIEGEWDDNIDDITGTLFCPNCGCAMKGE